MKSNKPNIKYNLGEREKTKRDKHHRKRGDDIAMGGHAGIKFEEPNDGGDGDVEVSNYGQKMPATLMGEMMGGGQDAPLMPIHF
jgi:hypothetical protein